MRRCSLRAGTRREKPDPRVAGAAESRDESLGGQNRVGGKRVCGMHCSWESSQPGCVLDHHLDPSRLLSSSMKLAWAPLDFLLPPPQGFLTAALPPLGWPCQHVPLREQRGVGRASWKSAIIKTSRKFAFCFMTFCFMCLFLKLR